MESRISPNDIKNTNKHTKFFKSFGNVFGNKDQPPKKGTQNSPHKMLTSCQLADLFRRLDKNGNGELELSEFLLIVNKLRIPVDEDYVNRVFREVDVQKAGFLNMEEFITGYQLIYTRAFKSNINLKPTEGHPSVPNELVYAIRYGLDELKNHIFEVYSGLSSTSSVILTEKRTYFTENFGQYKLENLENFTLTKLNEEIVNDSERNLNRRTKVFWWIDVCMERIEPSRVDQYIANFGLPNDIKFRTMFSQFGIRLPRDPNGHMYAGNGSSPCGSVSSLSFFYHALWISSVPVVYHLPSWVHEYGEKIFNQSTYRLLRRYYDTRFAFFFSSLMESPVNQQRIAYEGAQSLGDRLFEDYDYHTRPIPPFSLKQSSNEFVPKNNEVKDIQDNSQGETSSIFIPPVLDELEDRRDDIPIWLQTGTEMKNTASRMNYETISFHILDAGYGSCAVLTFREADVEKDLTEQNVTVPSPTDIYCSGILGRLLCSIRRKILENMCNEGVTVLAGDLTDCPFSLVSMMVTLISNFSMNTLGPLHAWKKLIDLEVDDVAVSKHVDHCSEMKKISTAIKVYVDQTTTLFNNLFTEAATDRSNESILQNLSEQHLDNQFETDSSLQLFTKVWGVVKTAKKLTAKSRASSPPTNYRRTEKNNILPHGAEDLPIHFELVQNFMGSTPCTYLKNILYGDEHLELKGILYWADRMNDFNESVELLSQKIQFSLEEKRNFFSYLLSVVTIFLGPLTVLTGYWGMNFDNMKELDSQYYPLTPGVKLLWAVGYFLYGIFIILAIHYRFLYSAT